MKFHSQFACSYDSCASSTRIREYSKTYETFEVSIIERSKDIIELNALKDRNDSES